MRQVEQAELLDISGIARRSVRGTAFTIIASAITAVFGLVRSVVLARLLLPSHFGVVTLALFFLSVATQVQRFGLSRAFIHRNDDSSENLSTFASLRVGLTAVAVLLTMIAAPFLARLYPEQPQLAPVLVVLCAFQLLGALNAVPEVILTRELQFRRLAILDVASSLSMTVVAPTVAWAGGGVWALVAEHITGTLVRAAGMWLYRRPWRPVFGLDKAVMRWYFRFGSSLFAEANLTLLVNRFDDFWTGTSLGATALGLYSRAYEFAQYPRRLLAGPMMRVFFPVFAQLQEDRLRLSKAFFRVCSVLVRGGFLLFGPFAIVVPEFIQLFLGEKWLPMAFTFQLMLIYTLLDPLLAACSNLLSAVGQPRLVLKVRVVQAAIFVPAVVALAYLYGIDGVALAADLMLIVGLGLMFLYARQHVDFSIRSMFLVPSVGLACAISASLLAQMRLRIASPAPLLLVKASISILVFGALLFALEREQSLSGARLIADLLTRSRSTSTT